MDELSWSEKDYIETIYILRKKIGTVRCIDVATFLNHSKPSITRAINKLSQKGYLKKNHNELEFTVSGLQAAEQIAERHCILAHTLQSIGIEEQTAINDARKMERVISEKTIASAAESIRCQKRLNGHCPDLLSMDPPPGC